MNDQAQTQRKQIENEAKFSYNRIAESYDDPSHETVRNFEALTLDFLNRHINCILSSLKTPRKLSIDIAGGRGWVARLMSEHGYRAILGDISDQMLLHARKQHGDHLLYCQLSAFCLPFSPKVANLVTTMLCGAYLCREVVEQINRILIDGGIYIVSETPREWVAATQSARGMPNGKTWYKDNNGRDVLLPFNYIYTLDELKSLVVSCGFEVVIAETLTPSIGIPPERISKVNRKAAEALSVPMDKVPMLSALIARKQ